MGGFFGPSSSATSSSGGGGLAGAALAANLSAGAHNDYTPGGSPAWPGTAAAPYGRLFLTLAADANLTGLVAGLDGQQVQIVNVSGGNLTLNDQNAGSAAANRFQTGPGGGVILGAGASIHMIYTAGSINRWVVSL